MKTIRVLISPKGEVTVETKGFMGASCRDASKFIEEALGTRTDETLKAEFPPNGHRAAGCATARLIALPDPRFPSSLDAVIASALP